MAGLSMSAIAPSSIGLFMEPLQREFGWSRAQISVGMTIYALVAFPLSPIGGMMIDRWGSRRIAIPGTILTAVAIAGFGSASGSAVQWLALWLFYAFAALAVKPTVWSAAVTGVFTGGRGLALALTLSGNAIAQTLVPVLAQRLIDTQGWRSAYQWIGLGWGAAVLILLVPFFYGAGDRRDDASPGTRAQVRASLYGITPRQALRTPVLIRIAIATLIGTMTSAALTIHLVPILSERGIDRETAALLAALTGIMGIVGKLVTGSLYDRRDLRWLNPLSLWIALVACLILLFAPGTLALAALATAIIGYSGGALLQVCAYLTGRFCGVRYFGTIFGTMTSMIALGVGLGPFLAGLSYDLSGSYTPMLIGLLPLMAISGLLLIRLGPYPDWRQPAG
jgi:predicted MFS family arabinose efflux permease